MKVVWSPEAIRQLGAIGRFVALDDPAGARRLIDRLRSRARDFDASSHGLQFVPECPRADVHELIEGGYRLVFRVQSRRLSVLTVHEAHQR